MSGVRHTLAIYMILRALPARPSEGQKPPAGGSRPGRAVQDRACRIESDAARLGRVVLTIRQRSIRKTPEVRGAAWAAIRRMGSCEKPERAAVAVSGRCVEFSGAGFPQGHFPWARHHRRLCFCPWREGDARMSLLGYRRLDGVKRAVRVALRHCPAKEIGAGGSI